MNNTDRPYFNSPTPEQMDKISEYTGLTPADIVVIKIRAADNLLNREWGAWGIKELHDLAAISPGIPLLLNHDWDRIQDSCGKVFDAEVRIHSGSSDLSLKAINRAGNLDVNRGIVGKDGYAELVFSCYMREYSGMTERILAGEWSHVSLGGFRFRDYYCPLCNIPFQDERCPHLLPHPTHDIFDGEYAPYYIRKDVFDIGEISFVTIPNLPQAQVILKESLESTSNNLENVVENIIMR